MAISQTIKFGAALLTLAILVSSEENNTKVTDKRSVLDLDWAGAYGGWVPHQLPVAPPLFGHGGPWKPSVIWAGAPAPVSAAEVAAAVASARDASAQVSHAQHDAQLAREEVLAQQKLASAKEMQAAEAVQRSEAIVAGARAAASAAAHAVVIAQQRVAAAKARVAFAQRAAAAREATAAAAIQKHAAAAADEIRRTDLHSAKLSAIHSSDAAAAAKYVTATKDATLVHLAGPSHSPHSPWDAFLKPVEVNPWG